MRRGGGEAPERGVKSGLAIHGMESADDAVGRAVRHSRVHIMEVHPVCTIMEVGKMGEPGVAALSRIKKRG